MKVSAVCLRLQLPSLMSDCSQTLDPLDTSKVSVSLKRLDADLLGVGYTASPLSPLYSSQMPRFLRRCDVCAKCAPVRRMTRGRRIEEDHPQPRRRIRLLGLLIRVRDDPLSAAILENPYVAAPRFFPAHGGGT